MNYRTASEESVETIAGFGSGVLVKTAGGSYRFQGGSCEDLIDAKEWIALFAPEMVLDGE